jgi:SAM-dependent methyltransferase
MATRPEENPTGPDWGGARGQKWRAQAAGTEATLAPIDEPLIQALRLDHPYRIADVGCGGGRTSFAIHRRAPAGSVVHGYDISSTLVELANDRARVDAPAVTFQLADAAKATVDPPYDRMVSRFGIMFFDDPLAAFTNLARWLVPGGRVAFAVWARTSDNAWFTSVRDVVSSVVELPPPLPHAPGPFRYGDVDVLLDLLARTGFAALEAHDWRGALAIGGGLASAEAADFALASFSSFGESLAAAGEEAVATARRSLTAAFAPHESDGAVRMGARVHVVSGLRP